MKTMKIALSIVAIAAIAAIYSTGAFVPQTHGIENTFEGFLVISDAEMAQHVGGPDEGIQRVNHSGPDQDVASCGSSNPDCNIDRQVRDATLYACDNCPASVFDNYDNTWHHADKYSYYYYVNGNRKTSYQGLRILSYCREVSNGCKYHESDSGWDFDNNKKLPNKQKTCINYVGKCNNS